ncbi:putative N-acetyltransferase YitH [Folsomia candida]|uniref:Putative N-acetyltransferase YitH n=1 Tax=Folsomia candida TaxID=158441 RepID=A0A226CZU9_FOLCA|nr:putative N-acetyltransferase YitH [Folsomia candida]
MGSKLVIRDAVASDVASYIEWGLAEGWNITEYPSGIGHIGYVIVGKEWRGQGVGTALLRHTLDNHLAACGLGVALYSAVEEVPFYENLGFHVERKAFRMSRPTTLEDAKLSERKAVKAMNPNTDLEKIAQFDATLSGSYRPGFWAQFSKGKTNHGVFLVVGEAGEMLGLGALRSMTFSTRVGPIYAKSAGIAEAILLKLLSQVEGGGPVTLDTFTDNAEAIETYGKHGLTRTTDTFLLRRPPVKETMVEHEHPSSRNLQKIFAITSLDFN